MKVFWVFDQNVPPGFGLNMYPHEVYGVLKPRKYKDQIGQSMAMSIHGTYWPSCLINTTEYTWTVYREIVQCQE